MKRLALLATLAVACVGPSTTVRTVDTRPAIAVVGAPPGAELIVDGLDVGPSARFNGNPNILRLEPGTHDVEIRSGGRVIFTQRVFVESELKTIKVH